MSASYKEQAAAILIANTFTAGFNDIANFGMYWAIWRIAVKVKCGNHFYLALEKVKPNMPIRA
jgi:hypothetical protein